MKDIREHIIEYLQERISGEEADSDEYNAAKNAYDVLPEGSTDDEKRIAFTRLNNAIRGLRIYNPAKPPDDFPYQCGIKSISTQSPTPSPDESSANTNLNDLPILYYGYGGVGDFAEELATNVIRNESAAASHATDEEAETLTIYAYIKFAKFDAIPDPVVSSDPDIFNGHKNIINTAACIHGMVSQFILDLDLKLEQNLEDMTTDELVPEELGNLSQVSLGSVVPFFQGLGPIEWLRFEILISFVYRR